MKNHKIQINGLVLGVIAIGIEGLIVSPVLRDIALTFHEDIGVTAWAVAVYGLALAVTAPIFGLYGSNFSRKTSMLLGMVLFSTSGLLCALSTSFTQLLIARGLCGSAAGIFLPACYAYIGDNAPYEQRGRLMGRIMAGWSVALIIGIPVGSIIGDAFGWRITFAGVSLIGIISAGSIYCLPNPSTANRNTLSVGGNIKGAIANGTPKLLLVNFLDMLSFYGVYTFLGSVVREKMEATSGYFGAMVMFYGLGLLISTMNSRVLDRFGKERSVFWALMLIGFVLTTLTPAAGSFWILPVCMLIWGAGQGIAQTGIATAVTHASGDARGFATACMSCTTYLAVATGSAGGGLILTAYGFPALTLAGALCALLASVVLHRLSARMENPQALCVSQHDSSTQSPPV